MDCRDCIHFNACGQWYPKEKLISDDVYKGCEHFEDAEKGEDNA